MRNAIFKEANNIFFVGIGGIGVSALARVLKATGKQISGSDLEDSEIIQNLRKEGIKIYVPHNRENLPKDADLVIFSVAVPESNPERARAKELNIPQISYPEALGRFIADKRVIAVAGTNGKTTTTAMIGRILEEAGEDPTVIVGSNVNSWNSNARFGRGEYAVIEADEYRRAFLNYSPEVAVITNIEVDHLDYFKDLTDVKNGFREFTRRIKRGGILVYNYDNPNAKELAENTAVKKISFGLTNGLPDIFPGGVIYEDMKLQVPGEFNKANALAAAAACAAIGISREKIIEALGQFTGTWRRFQKVGKFGSSEIISDYAHHPAGVTVILDTAADEFAGKRILAVFQPHQRNRTKHLFREFVTSFCRSELHNFIIAEIFDVAGREKKGDEDVSSIALAEEIKKCGKHAEYVKNLEDCEQKIRDIAAVYDVIIFMGAGDIYKVAEKLAK